MIYALPGLAIGFALGYALGKRRKRHKIPYALCVRVVEMENMKK